ncbi:hypothetical protein CYLTODRAFT_193631 [Cylindrobasidium torrendii FP15055 ss-10]|uniref:GST N-terminal domain-containing protein n=1 Tax=Cylindrobasidium torrendii FP15055 ss-10 TaxID=1314674 RepID=A0A0D7BTC0_9AGAR|nr:hypothetical protein CYLTODRAFT_193631 [Cylindrobasidium torrendii FP15055 ss-10]
MTSQPPVIIYRYNASPFSIKIDNVLLLKGIDAQRVNVQSYLPRPEITNLLGVGYRRIPIVAIGGDVYCDTSLIASALERRFPPAKGYGTIFPKRVDGGSADAVLVQNYAQFYADNIIFPLAPAFLPWEKFPDEFLKDRESFAGAPMNRNYLVALRPKNYSILVSHITEELLADGRDWLFNTVTPSLADVALHFPIAWAMQFPSAKDLINSDSFPRTFKWMQRLNNAFDDLRKTVKTPKISGEDAAKTIASSSREDEAVVGFDTTEANRLGLKRGDIVDIAPQDTGRKNFTTGPLICLNREEYVIETKGTSGDTFRIHLPRVGYSIRKAKGQSKL